MNELADVHPLIQALFFKFPRNVKECITLKSDRISFYPILTSNKNILNIVSNSELDFLEQTHQTKTSKQINMSREEELLLENY